MREFAGKVAVVTGAASGIGLALARELGGRGMRIALADIDADSLQSAALDLEKPGSRRSPSPPTSHERIR